MTIQIRRLLDDVKRVSKTSITSLVLVVPGASYKSLHITLMVYL